jgi:hypothetical protein
MLSVQAPTRKYQDAPPSMVLMPLRCKNLGTWQTPYYHGGGLLPECLDGGTCVLAPDIYVPKGKWDLQPLTLEKVLVAKDFGHILPDLLATGRLENHFLQ